MGKRRDIGRKVFCSEGVLMYAQWVMFPVGCCALRLVGSLYKLGVCDFGEKGLGKVEVGRMLDVVGSMSYYCSDAGNCSVVL